MSSCFLCDTSHNFVAADKHSFYYKAGLPVEKSMKQVPIMIGSSGTGKDDQQHENNNKQNYVSYIVKRLEFRGCTSSDVVEGRRTDYFPDYVLIFKVPMREPIIDYDFNTLNKFILYSEPECVLSYKVIQDRYQNFNDPGHQERIKHPNRFDIIITKPFVVGPNDYVGVFYMFTGLITPINSSAKVWFDLL